MRILIRYSTLSSAYYVACMLSLTLFTFLNMRSMEHGVDPISGTRTISALCLIVCIGSLTRLYWVKDYKLYRPTTTILLYLAYLIWIFFPTLMNDIKDDNLSDVVIVLVDYAMPICTLLITYNHMMNYGECRWLKWFFCGMAIVYVIGYIQILWSIQSFSDMIQMIVSYFTLYMLPLILLTSGRKTRILFIIITLLILTTSVKRGGLVALASGLIVYGVVYLFTSRKVKISTIIGSVVVVAMLVGIFMVIGTSDEANVVERFENMEQDEGSGRTVVWYKAWQLIKKSDVGCLIVGHGYDKVLEDSQVGYSAHNDFLEITYDYGLVGLLLYLAAGLSLLHMIWILVKQKSSFAPSMSMFFAIYFVLSMISHVIIYPWANIIMLTISYISAREKLYARNE